MCSGCSARTFGSGAGHAGAAFQAEGRDAIVDHPSTPEARILPFERVVLVVGLGNPGREYRANRHNAGAMLADRLARDLGVSFRKRVGLSLVAEGKRAAGKVILAKPTTYMNESGRAVLSLLRTFRSDLSSLLVLCDDLDLPFGRIRLRPDGGSAGHRGLASIIDAVESGSFARLRIGIGRPEGTMDPADFVLEDFLPEEASAFEDALARAAECTWMSLDESITAAMNACNGPTETG